MFLRISNGHTLLSNNSTSRYSSLKQNFKTLKYIHCNVVCKNKKWGKNKMSISKRIKVSFSKMEHYASIKVKH